MDGAAPLTLLPPRFADWFDGRRWRPRAHQLAMLQKAQEGRDTLLIAPTGGGKTLAGFLPSLVELSQRPKPNTPPGVHTLYISPLKALATDVERNLRAPAAEMKLPITIEARTGDMSVAKRQRQRLHPPDMLLTTPEQLALFCAWEGSRRYFEDLRCVVIDEIHAIHSSKRGDLLSLGLARLQSFAPQMRRVGLSATVNDPDMIRRWLTPAPAMADLVMGEPGAPAVIDVLLSENRVPWAGHTAQHAMAEVYDVIRRSQTALVFVNTRWQAEFAFQELWRLNDDNLPIALHHGSLSAEQRRKVEAAMARGDLRAVVCTSTLDLGIDWGAVDIVIQLAAPKGSSRLVQRIGRANHRLDEPSRALLVPANRFEMLECQAAREAVAENALDGDPIRTGAPDVLAQHIMGVACGEAFSADDLFTEITTAAPFADVTRPMFDRVLEFVSTGGYALKTYDHFRRIVQGRDGLWRVRNGETALRHRLNCGAIVGAAILNLRLMGRRGVPGRKLGELEEYYVEGLTSGDTFVFGGQIWRFEGIVGADVLVTRSNDPEPRIPSFGMSKFPLSTYLAKRVRRMIQDEEAWRALPFDVQEWLHAQKDHAGIPQADELLVETFPHGKRHFMIAYPFDGRLAHTTLAMLLTRRLDRLGVGPLGFVANDYSVCIWALEPMDGLDFDALLQEDMLGDDLEAWLDESFMMKRTFRQCALISGLIERRFPGHEKSGRQVNFSSDLIYDVLRRHQPDHLLLECARTEAATGQLDIARLGDLLKRVKGRLRVLNLPKLSPFAVPALVEIGRESVPGRAGDMILEAASLNALIAEALA
ncbi:ligase-associated DNA damage response DEXH box helicase [Phenylobacterium montanum]|uniref:Ligase-associated DNA damage response DEXH box helicase n=1 Tax=Phenylobacterium montanum TaxID=2823693 RepID=A0A975FY06_9CAUL|nr:ligase-associated DNA damage response DEXH box helicase [Caulobacter sp. S6]QUD86907.1 ligase-associated DNA damage response DEXH box helicase [Caulobacter sp. S6]